MGADCDAFALRYILHDWDDESNVSILKNIRNVAKKSKKDTKPVVVVMDQIIDTGAASFFEKAKSQMAINMIASCPYGARERTVQEHSDLFDAAGYENVGVGTTTGSNKTYPIAYNPFTRRSGNCIKEKGGNLE